MTNQTSEMHSIFPCPVHITKRDSNLSSKEEKEIEDIIKEGMSKNIFNSISTNTYIFDTKLKSTLHTKRLLSKTFNHFCKY